jgi:hypothetical protein
LQNLPQNLQQDLLAARSFGACALQQDLLAVRTSIGVFVLSPI